jgi:hypothetical protein
MPAPVLQFKRGNAGVAGTVPALRPGEPAISLNNFDFFIGIDTSVANNKFLGSHRYWGREDGTNALNLKLVDKNGTNYVAIKAPNTLGGNVTYTLPGTQGTSSSVLTNDGSGNLVWASGSANPVFTGISTFTDGTDNTLGNADTGAVQIDGGLGVNKNVTIGAGLSVAGQSYFIGTATFYGGQINLGDSDTDDIVVAGEFKSNLIPSDDATYNLGNGSKRWNNASFAGIGTFATGAVVDTVQIGITGADIIDTASGKLTLDSATQIVEVGHHLNILGDLDVTGNVYIGGTTVTLRGQDVLIENKDIVLGYTTSVTPSDDSANHAGVAIASTVGTPLTSFTASGINTLPDTYKQMMWFKSGTLGFSTDAFAFNYGVAIGTTTMANGVRLAVGSGVTVSDTSVSATTFYGSVVGSVTGNVSSADQVKTVTASDTNANYYVTFVDANNGSATNESVYTDDGIYYNPGTNTFVTQHASLTGDLNVSGITTLSGNVLVSGIATVSSNLVVGGDVRINGNDIQASDGNTNITLTSNTLTAFAGDIKVGGNDIQASDGNTNITLTSNTLTEVKGELQVTGNVIKSSTGATAITLAANDVTVADDLTVQGNLYVNGNTTQVNTSALTVEDRTIELGRVDGSTPSSATTWDLGVLFNYNASGAKKSAVVWEHSATRFQFASVLVLDTDGTDVNTPQLSVTTFAPIEIGSLWVTDCAGTSQVISCTGSTRNLENITIDAGTF